MKIGIDVRELNASQSGQQRYLWRMAIWMARQGHDVHVFTVKRVPHGLQSPEGVTIHPLYGLSSAELRGRIETAGLDAFLANPERAANYAGLRVNVLRAGYGTSQGRQNLRSVQNPVSLAIYRLQRQLPPKRNALRIERDFYLQKDPSPQVIAISDYMWRDIQKDYATPDEQLHRVFNGVDVDEFTVERRNELRPISRRRWNISDDAVCFLFVGHNYRRKGLHQLMTAFARVREDKPDARMLIAGKGTSRSQVRLAGARARWLNCRDALIFAGSVTPVIEAYAAADVFVFPSWHDAFGFVALEAMACGLPVITSRLAGASEIITDGREGFIVDTPLAIDALADRLNRFFDPEVRSRMGSAARELAEQHTEEHNFRQVLEVFERAASQSSTAGTDLPERRQNPS